MTRLPTLAYQPCAEGLAERWATRRGPAIVFAAGFGITWAMWEIAMAANGPFPFGHDGLWRLAIALALCGAAAATIRPRFYWASPLGVVLGQALYLTFRAADGPLWLIGVIFSAMYGSLAAGAGAVTVWIAASRLADRWHRH